MTSSSSSTTTTPPHNLNLPLLATRLHNLYMAPEPLLLTNVHDHPTATLIASLPSTTALATASWAIAAQHGVRDDDMTLSQNLDGIASVAAGLRASGRASEVPLSADLQDAYEEPAESVRLAVGLGVVGANVEDLDCKDRDGQGRARLRGVEEQVGRLRECLRGAREAGCEGFVVNARTDVLGYGGTMEDVVVRGKAYLAAGAKCVFVWGAGKHDIQEEEVRYLVRELEGKVSIQPGVLGMAVAKKTGVARVSTGPALWRKGMQEMKEEAVRLMEA